MEKEAELVQKRSRLSAAQKALLQKRLLGSTTHEIKSAAIPRRAPDSTTILSFAQQRLWFLDQLEPGNPFYTIPLLIHLHGPLHIPLLHRCLHTLVQRHETLRTNFVIQEENPLQRIVPSRSILLPLTDLEVLAEADRSARAEHLAHLQALLPFDLSHDALIRCSLFRLAPQHHILLLTLHHIIADGWSLDILNRELATLYHAFLEGRASPLPPLPIQYADFALWQHTWLQGDVLQQQLTYWRKQLADLAPLELPLDHPRPPIQSFHGALIPFRLHERLSHALLEHCKHEGVTLFMALLSAFQMLLSRYTGQTDIAVGTPVSGRTKVEMEGLVGFFVNTLIIRTDLASNPNSQDVLARIKQTALQAFHNQDIPFEKLVEDLQPERNLSRTPLIQTLFTLKVPSASSQRIADLTLQASELASETTQFDLMLTMDEEQHQISGQFQYNTDLFDASTIQRMSSHFIAVLEALVHTPHLPLREIPLLSQEELQQILVQWNETSTPYPPSDALHTLFETQVARTPDAIAVLNESTHLSYDQLNRHANQLAHHLSTLGVGPDVLVGVCMERSHLMPLALLSILKAGGAYVPLDPEYPSERLLYMLTDIASPVVLTQSHLAPLFSPSLVPTLCLDQENTVLTPYTQENPPHQTTGSNLAYVIYTSGSTGTPKGAMNTHHGICNRLLWMQDAYHLTSSDRVLQKTPYSFDVSVWEFFWPLLTGACLIMARPGGHRDSGYLVRTILEHHITTLHFVPSMLSTFLEEERVEELSACLQRVICSGETLSAHHLKRFFSLLDAHLYNLYGPTEAAVDVTAWTCLPDTHHAPIPIGHPIANLEIYVLDQWMRPVPVRVPGELYIGGAGLARGYLKHAGLTAEKFVPHPFSTQPGARLYRTGDLVRYQTDGTIDYLGRIDHQVKLRGQRIELGEIEHALQRHEAVQESVVLVHEENQRDKWLIAYLVIAPGKVFSESELRRDLQTHLPQYMIPAQFLVLDALPLTSNGKVDRRALARSATLIPTSREIVPPRTVLETQLVTLWSEMLKLDEISIHENFFAIGGHSLLATQVISRLRTLLGIEVALKSLFEHPTIAEIALQIEQKHASEQIVKTPILPISRTQPLLLSFAQQRLWFLDQLESQTTAYLIPLAIRLQGKLDVRLLQRSIQAIVQRHESLRTTFTTSSMQPVQVIHATMHIPIACIDLHSLPAAQQTTQVAYFVQKETHTPFHLNKGPLIRGNLLRIDEQEHILLIVMHHIISDAWSLGIMAHELAAFYNALMQGKPAQLPPLPIQYADFAAWQHNWLQGAVLESLTNYWKKQLSGASLLALPTARPPDQIKSARGAKHLFTLPATLSQALTSFSQQEGVTLFMTLLAAFQTLLYLYTNQTDSVIGTDIANRTHEESEKLIGFFVNLLVLRTDLSGKPSFRELLQRVRKMVLDAYAHQDLPFEKLVDELQLERSTHQTPLVRALFVLQNTPMPPLELPGIVMSPMGLDLNTAKFDLAAFLWEDAGTITGMLNYRTDAFDAQTIETVALRFVALLHSLVTQPEKSIDLLNISSTSELQEREQKETAHHTMNRQKLKIARRSVIQA